MDERVAEADELPVDHDRVTVVKLHREDPLSWVLMPNYMSRVTKFCSGHERASEAPIYRDLIAGAFGAGGARCLCVAYVRQNQVVGHLFATVEVVVGERVGWMLQWEKDEGIPRDPEIDRQVRAHIETWAATAGVRRLVAVPATEGLVTGYRRFGFAKVGTLVSREMHHER